MRRLLLVAFLLTISFLSKSQNPSYTCPRDTILGCNTSCLTIKAQFPDLRDVGDDYTFTNVSPQSVCRPYVGPDAPGPSTALLIDDRFSAVIPIGFSFRFYGSTYTDLVVSTNGYLSFNSVLAGGFSPWVLNTNVPNAAYPAALVMGPWHDLDPSATTSPSQQIKYNLLGTAPTRKWVLSFYKVPQFSGVCNPLIENTHQIVLHESTGIIEVFIFDKQICPTWNSGRSMVGLQDMTRTKGIVPPLRGAVDPPWGAVGMNEVWRFIPTGGAPLYRSVELLDATGTVVATGDTTRLNINTFETSFPNICPPAGASLYVVKTTYRKLDDPATTTFSLDTINVIRQPELPVTGAMLPTTCGANTGTITVTSAGTAPYQYSIDGGTLQSSNIFTNVSQGPHTIYSVDATGCANTITVDVTSISSLPSTVVKTNTSCPGVNNGSITVTPTAGTGPYVFTISSSAVTNTTGAFTNLSPGSYTVTFTDANGCTGSTTAQTVAAGTAITSTLAGTTATSCSGINDGRTTITPTSGTGPYTYLVDGNPVPSNVITGLSAGSHTITITDAAGCTGTRTVFIGTGAGINAGTPNVTPTSCPGVNNGTITITPLNGVAPYTYSTTGVGGPFSPGPITGLAATIQTITVKDANGCTGSVTVALTSGSGITASGVTTASSCAGVNNGTITITTSGTAPYAYSLDAGTTYTPLVGNVISGLAPGPYSVIVRDVNGCKATVSANVASGTVIAATTAGVATSCPGATNGSITVTPTNGVPPYTYSINNGVTYLPLVANTISGLAPGSYTIIIRDNNSCSGTLTETVPTGAAITITPSTTATSCPGLSNGTVSFTTSTSAAPYSYSSNGGTTFTPVTGSTISNLPAGAITFIIKDANGCTVDLNATIAAGPALAITASTVASTCPGATNGSINITSASGTGPFSYSLNAGVTYAPLVANTIGGLTSGNYTVTIKDATGCTGETTVTIAPGTALTISTTSTVTSCPGINDGTINIVSTSGVAPLQYSLDGGTTYFPLVANTINGVPSGTNTVRIKDINGCTGDVTVTVASGSALTATTATVSTSCPGVDNGTVTITPTSGTAAYTYSPDGTTFSPLTAAAITGLAAGAYVYTIKDAIGCTGPVNFTIATGAALTINATPAAVTCPGVSNGTITINSTNGTAPYQYSLDAGVTFLPLVANTITGLSAGSVTYSIKDANGCIGQATVTIGPGTGLTGTAAGIATGCPTVNNGSVTATPTTGTAPYTYSIDGGVTYQASATFLNLAPGSYTITFKDVIGCTGSATATVTSGSGLTASAPVIVGTSCPGVNNGTITITPTTGTAPYTYTIDGNPNAGNIFIGLAAGPHAISFTDALGCIGTLTATVPAGVNLASTTIVANPPCANINDGTITINPTTGVAPYTYSIDNGVTWQTSNVFAGLAPGTYNFNMRDNIGCVGTKTATLTTNTALATTLVLTRPLCNGDANGKIVVSASGGVTPYQFSKDGGSTYQTNGTFAGLTAGTYTFRIKDNVGCLKDTIVTLTEPTALSVTASNLTEATCAGNDGNITVTGNGGGTPGYQYSIDNGVTYQPGNTFSVSAGNYPDIMIQDANGCTAGTSVTVVGIDNMYLTLGPDTTICIGESYTFQPATNPETSIFNWGSNNTLNSIPAGTIDNSTYQYATITPTDSFTYVLTAQWGVCAPKTDTINVFVKKKPVVDAGIDQFICFEDTTAVLQGLATNLSGSVNYSWSPAAQLQTPANPITLATLFANSQYTLTVTDNYGCNFIVSDSMLVSLQPPVPAFAGNDTIAVPNQPHQLMGSGGVAYEWAPSAPLDLSQIANPMAVLNRDQQFVLTVTDRAGCLGYDTVFIKVYNGPTYYVPNAFSPNGDGLNDVFRAIPTGIASTDYFRVFNRFGTLLFETDKFLKGWDGRFQGKAQPIGTYVWTVKGTDKNGKLIQMKGTVLLVQ